MINAKSWFHWESASLEAHLPVNKQNLEVYFLQTDSSMYIKKIKKILYDINILFYKSSELNSCEREYCFLMSDHEDRLYLLRQHTQRCHSSSEGICSETYLRGHTVLCLEGQPEEFG